ATTTPRCRCRSATTSGSSRTASSRPAASADTTRTSTGSTTRSARSCRPKTSSQRWQSFGEGESCSVTRCRRRTRRSTRRATSDARHRGGCRPAAALVYEHMFVEDPSVLSKEELERELLEQAAHVDAALCRLVELADECEARLDWSGEGTTFAAWLAWRCSLAPRQAREHARL